MKSLADARRLRYARFLCGRGLEIGALGNPMPLPLASEVVYSDLLSPAQIEAMYPGARHPDIVSDSESFPSVPDGTFDFVVANHVLEHVTDPLRALIEWHRILRPGGLLLLSVPDKRYTFDHRRRRTPLAHLFADHESDLPPALRNECHLLDWAENVEGLAPGSAAFDSWVSGQKERGYTVHNHVWIPQDVFPILAYLRGSGTGFALVRWNDTSPLGNEFNLLLARRAPTRGEAWRERLAFVSTNARNPMHAVASRLRRVSTR